MNTQAQEAKRWLEHKASEEAWFALCTYLEESEGLSLEEVQTALSSEAWSNVRRLAPERWLVKEIFGEEPVPWLACANEFCAAGGIYDSEKLLHTLDRPQERTWRGISLSYTPMRPDHLRALFASESLSNPQALHLESCGLSDKLLEDLAKLGRWDQLKMLDLSNNDISHKGLLPLLQSQACRSLVQLTLSRAKIGTKGLRSILREDGLPHLQELQLFDTKLDSVSMREFRSNASVRSLVSLDLSNNRLGQSGIKQLVESPHFTGLTKLTLDRCDIDDKALETLLEAPWLGQLQQISLAANPLTTKGAQLLAQAIEQGKLPQLQVLSVYLVSTFTNADYETFAPFKEKLLLDLDRVQDEPLKFAKMQSIEERRDSLVGALASDMPQTRVSVWEEICAQVAQDEPAWDLEALKTAMRHWSPESLYIPDSWEPFTTLEPKPAFWSLLPSQA
ncbi:MAG: hypothetical protein H6728_16280 [Myxococcales bacterium]|nr:hypothetical protein [Myxococcales bacterium]